MQFKQSNKIFMGIVAALAMLPMTNQKSLAIDLRDFVIYNENNLPITRLYISFPSSDYWGSNILNTNIYKSESSTISFSDNSTQCVYDVKAVYSNGTYDVGRYNLCTTYIVYFYGYGGDYSPRRR